METLGFKIMEYVLLSVHVGLGLVITFFIIMLFELNKPKITEKESFGVFTFVFSIGISIYLIRKIIYTDAYFERSLYCGLLGAIYAIVYVISICATILWIIFYKIVLYPVIKIATYIVDKLSDKFAIKEDYKNQETVDKIWDKTTEIIVKIHIKKKKDEA